MEGSGKDAVPEIFLALISFFEANPDLMQTQTLFRKNSTPMNMDSIDFHLSHGNFHYLNTILADPYLVANHIKRILREMAEPLCTYKLYPSFKQLTTETDPEVLKQKLRELCSSLPPKFRNTLALLCHFMNKLVTLS